MLRWAAIRFAKEGDRLLVHPAIVPNLGRYDTERFYAPRYPCSVAIR